jgi:hypothetical protein
LPAKVDQVSQIRQPRGRQISLLHSGANRSRESSTLSSGTLKFGRRKWTKSRKTSIVDKIQVEIGTRKKIDQGSREFNVKESNWSCGS